MQALGADVIIVPSDGGRITNELIKQMRQLAEQYAAEQNSYYTGQMENPDNVRGYELLGREILAQLDGSIDVFCAAVGSAGLLMGAARGVEAAGSNPRIVALEPSSSPALTAGRGGAHRVEGIALGYKPPLLDDALYHEARTVEKSKARETARRLAREEGLFAGTSSGLNVAGALRLAAELGVGKTVVTVAVDTGLKYLAGDLYGID